MDATQVQSSVGPVSVSASDWGEGRPFVIFHGGAGPASVSRFAEFLGARGQVRAIVPIHPGFQGTPRPEGLTTIAGLAEVYSHWVDDLGLQDTVVVGNSIGGWIGAELALLKNPRISRLVLVDAGGLVVDGHPAPDVFALSLDQISQMSYHDPEKFRIDPSKMTEQQRAVVAGNRAALKLYGGAAMADRSLLERARGIQVPTLVVWGAADRMLPREHGEAYAAAIPGARLEIIEEAGHLPQLEAPEHLVRVVKDFSDGPARHV
jgi:pimeloyl-ACP methyl ester carboxylesterase